MRTLKQRYTLHREIGRGASGRVWIAQDLQLGRRVAVKLLDRDNIEDNDARIRFEREAWTVAQLKSPHIVQVFDLGVDEGVPFIVMELLHGESLEDRLQRHPKLPLRIVASVISDIAKGLTVSHLAGIIHRDLKPANVYLARENGSEVVKLLDFGIAALATRAEPQFSIDLPVMGTPHYMSPEHFSGRVHDPRADLWSLAVLAYQMLTGRYPFEGRTLPQLRERTRHCTFLRPTELDPQLEGHLDAFFERAFSNEASERFQHAEDLSAALDEIARPAAKRVVRILLVDDEDDMVILYRQWFRKELRCGQYELFTAKNGHEGLEELASRPDIDVILADINMPGMDGLTFLHKVPDVNPLVRVVIVSAYTDLVNIRAAMNRGAYDFLCKPIDLDDLRNTIVKCSQHTALLRRAHEFHQENDLLRHQLGSNVVDCLLAKGRMEEHVPAETIDGSVAIVGAWGWPVGVDIGAPALLLERVSNYFDMLATEVAARDGAVVSCWSNLLVAVYRGPDHLVCAIESSLAMVARVQLARANVVAERMQLGVAIGLATGRLVVGSVRSRALSGQAGRMILGTAFESAVRLQQLAQNGEILVSADLHKQVSTDYKCESVERCTQRVFCVLSKAEPPSGDVAVPTLTTPTVRIHD